MMTRWVLPMLALAIAGLSPHAVGQATVSSQLAAIVHNVEAAQPQPWPAYTVVREYHLFGTGNASLTSEVIAQLDYHPPNQKSYTIQKLSGSSRGEQIVKRILDHEVELITHNSGTLLNARNYNFNFLGEGSDSGKRYFILGLQPKRKDKDLVAGTAWVDEDNFLVRHVEGELAQSPSWWIKKVHVSIDFADVAGAWQQSRMEAVADVRVIGTQILRSETSADAGAMQAQAADARGRNRRIPAELLLLSSNKHR
jgi:hypothetical protein